MDDKQLGEITSRIRASGYDGELRLWKGGDFEVIGKAPSRGEFLRFQEMATDPKKRSKATEALVRACIVYPPGAELEAMLDKKPGLALTFGEKLVELAGAGVEVEEKKL